MYCLGSELSAKDKNAIAAEHRLICLSLFRGTLISQLIFPPLVVVVFWQIINHKVLLAWVFFHLLLTGFRYVVVYCWYKPLKASFYDKVFDFFVLATSFIAACGWIYLLIYIDISLYPEQTVFYYIVLFGLFSGAMGIGGYWPVYYFNYIGVLLLGFFCHVLFFYPQPNFILAFSIVAYCGFILHICLSFNRQSVENLMLKRKNLSLAHQYEEQKLNAENLLASKQHLLAVTSHDLRQPLQAINLFLASLSDQEAGFKQSKLFKRLSESIQGMNELLERMLDMSKLDSETLDVYYESTSLSKLFSKLRTQFAIEANNKKLQLSFCSNDLFIKTDPVLFERVLSNLLSNAIKYSDEGEVAVNAHAVSENEIEVSVTDTGVGVAKKDHAIIFEEFVQLSNPERDQKKGLGLGLSIVKRLASLLSIKIQLTSKVSVGTTVRLLCAATEEDNEGSAAAKNTASLFLPHNKNVLVIDDDLDIRDALSSLLKGWGFMVKAYSSAELAELALVQSKIVPDIIISDYRLRDKQTGIEAIAQIKALFPGHALPAFLLSGDTNKETLQRVRDEGYQLLHKPIKAAQLRMILQRALG